ncbi:MAG: hypothetical protein ACI936_003515 [Paraglaciecola sp.]
MPNLLAFAMILLWPFIAIVFYKKFDTVTATFWTIVGGYMFLPVSTVFDFPMIPAIGKDEISAIAAFIGCKFIKNENITLFGVNTIQKFIIFLLLFIPFVNVFFNSEPIFNGLAWIKGLTLYDAMSQILAQYLELLAFFIAVSIVKSRDDLEKVVRLLVIAGLIYSLLVLIEIRLSPQLHAWIYGFFPHVFGQAMRGDGFRAVVFMDNGLMVATFCFVCVCSAAIQVKISSPKEKIRNICILMYLLLIIVLQKSVGAIGLSFLATIIILFCYYSQQKIIIKLFIAIFFLYPTLSVLNLIPYEAIITFISDFSPERAGSTNYRFTNEIELVRHAYEKSLIGWGSWGRNTFWNSVTDGKWIIVYGVYGGIYFCAFFGLFTMGALTGISRNATKNQQVAYLGLSLILAGVLFDQIQNASLNSNWLWFLSGILCSPMLRDNETHLGPLPAHNAHPD